MVKFSYDKFFVSKLKYRTLHEKIMEQQDRASLYEFLEKLRVSILDPPFPFSEEAIEIFLQAWEDQHGKPTSFLFPHPIEEKEEEGEKSIQIYTPEMCLILANSLLMLFRLYDQDETRKMIQPIKEEVQRISSECQLIVTQVRINIEFKSEQTYKKLLRLQTRSVAIIAHQRETEL